MDDSFSLSEKSAEKKPVDTGLNLLAAGQVRDNPFQPPPAPDRQAEKGDIRANPWGAPPANGAGGDTRTKVDDKGTPWNPKPGDNVPAARGELSLPYRSMTPQQLESANPRKLIIHDFPESDRLRPSRDEHGKYFFFLQSDDKKRFYFPPNLEEIEIWQNGRSYNMSTASLKRQYDEWAGPAPSSNPNNGKTKNPYDRSYVPPPGGSSAGPGVPGFDTPVSDNPTSSGLSWRLAADRTLGAASNIAFTTRASLSRDLSYIAAAPETAAALRTERDALLRVAQQRQHELSGSLRAGFTPGDMFLRTRIESWPVSHLDPIKAAQHREWMALNTLIPEVRDARYVAGTGLVPRADGRTLPDPAVNAQYARYANARTSYETAVESNMAAARAAHRNMVLRNVGTLALSEGGKYLVDSTLFSDTPVSLRTIAVDTAAPLVMLARGPWYVKGGVIIGSHLVSRYLDSRFSK